MERASVGRSLRPKSPLSPIRGFWSRTAASLPYGETLAIETSVKVLNMQRKERSGGSPPFEMDD